MRRAAGWAGALLGLLVLVEVLAVPVGTRVLHRAVARCVDVETVEVRGVERPVVPGLLVGRLRDVEVGAADLRAGQLRVTEATLRADEVDLPWRLGGRQPWPARIRLRVDERDVERAVRDLAGVRLSVDLDPGVARLRAPLLPIGLDVEIEVEPDGTIVLVPAAGGDVLDRFGVTRRFPPTDTVRPTAVAIGDGEVTGELEVEVEGRGCDEPVEMGAAVSTARWPATVAGP